MIEVNRRQLLLGGVASVAASGVVASDAVAARAGETFIDTFAANQGHWVDTVGACRGREVTQRLEDVERPDRPALGRHPALGAHP